MHALITINKYWFNMYLIPITDITKLLMLLTDITADPIVGTSLLIIYTNDSTLLGSDLFIAPSYFCVTYHIFFTKR